MYIKWPLYYWSRSIYVYVTEIQNIPEHKPVYAAKFAVKYARVDGPLTL